MRLKWVELKSSSLALPLSLSPGEEGVRGERSGAFGQRADVPVGAGAEPPPAGALPGGGAETEAEEAHAEEPGLRRQLPGEEGVPARSPGAAEARAAAGGGAAGGGERRHATGAGGPGRPPGRPAEVRPGTGARERESPGHRPPSQHRLCHHHRQNPAPGTQPQGAGQLVGLTRARTHTHTHTHKHTHTHTRVQPYIHTHIGTHTHAQSHSPTLSHTYRVCSRLTERCRDAEMHGTRSRARSREQDRFQISLIHAIAYEHMHTRWQVQGCTKQGFC